MQLRLLLTQQFLAVAESFVLRCRLRRGSSRSKLQARWISNQPFAASCVKFSFLNFKSEISYLLVARKRVSGVCVHDARALWDAS